MSTQDVVVRRATPSRGLNVRIAVVSGVIVAQFWALAATLDGWLSGNTAAVAALTGFQGVCAGAAYAVRWLGHRNT